MSGKTEWIYCSVCGNKVNGSIPAKLLLRLCILGTMSL